MLWKVTIAIFIARIRKHVKRLMDAGHPLEDMYPAFQSIRTLPPDFQEEYGHVMVGENKIFVSRLGDFKDFEVESGDLLDFKQHFADKSIHRSKLEFKKQYQTFPIATKYGDLLDFKQQFADKSIQRLEFLFKAEIQEAVSVIANRYEIW
ncbi:hypothetical protein CDAR_20101 [Caerostris darwini]|uniref:Uncharacterized protein n=1 Tax=Caerostris darwini TaxID=1538125 RepID=A0AAV4PRX9_9ARAC|nr:hypothetical protein CDAR_20101 [Caerostris darwini]